MRVKEKYQKTKKKNKNSSVEMFVEPIIDRLFVFFFSLQQFFFLFLLLFRTDCVLFKTVKIFV